MTKNPIVNALAASVYIVFVASVIFYGSEQVAPVRSVFGPIAFISLFSLSAAIMGYIFLYQPSQLYLDGKKKIATDLFIKTLIYFAAVTSVFLTLFFSGLLK